MDRPSLTYVKQCHYQVENHETDGGINATFLKDSLKGPILLLILRFDYI